MNVPFLTTGNFTYRVHARRLERPAGSVYLSITSQWANARDPQAEQVAIGMTLSQADLSALTQALQAAQTL